MNSYILLKIIFFAILLSSYDVDFVDSKRHEDFSHILGEISTLLRNRRNAGNNNPLLVVIDNGHDDLKNINLDKNSTNFFFNLRKSRGRRRKKPAKKVGVKQEHMRKVHEVTEFMLEHYYSTTYLHKEIERIKKDRIVMDDLREMVRYLEQDGREKVKDATLKCFKRAKYQERNKDNTNYYTINDMVIHVDKDPINDGIGN